MYKLPEALDKDNDKVKITLLNPMPFLSLSAKTLFVFANPLDIGNYTIKIVLKDENPVPKTKQYEFEITLVEDSPDSLLPEFYLENKNKTKERIKSYPESEELTAKITNIDYYG